MSVARVTEISATSPEGFEAAINEGISRAARTLRGMQGAWIKDMNVVLDDGRVTGYRVHLAITFVVEEGGARTEAEAATPIVTEEVPPRTEEATSAPPRGAPMPPPAHGP